LLTQLKWIYTLDRIVKVIIDKAKSILNIV